MIDRNHCGRRLPIPSVLSIKTALRLAVALDDRRIVHAKANNLPINASWETINAHLTRKALDQPQP